MSGDPYFLLDNAATIIAWGYAPAGTVPQPGAGQSVALPSQAQFDGFISEYETSTDEGYGYRYPIVEGGPYFEADWHGTGIGWVYLSGGVPPASGSPAEEARARRNDLLVECDWTQLPDVALSAASVSAFATYRQSLRDVPQQSGFPTMINWPARPAEVNA